MRSWARRFCTWLLTSSYWFYKNSSQKLNKLFCEESYHPIALIKKFVVFWKQLIALSKMVKKWLKLTLTLADWFWAINKLCMLQDIWINGLHRGDTDGHLRNDTIRDQCRDILKLEKNIVEYHHSLPLDFHQVWPGWFRNDIENAWKWSQKHIQKPSL